MKHIHGFLASPPLWKHTQFGLKQFEIPSIDLSTFEPKVIPEKLRLGHRVEHIFHQVLSHSNAYEVLAHNIQVKKGNDTLGELDFIIRSCLPGRELRKTCTERSRSNTKLIHLELTYKFYILDTRIPELIYQLTGPNRKDTFYAKLEKTKQKQLPLIHTKEGRQTLKSLGIEATELEQQVVFMGQLFTPYSLKPPSIYPLNTACIVGFWIRMEDFKSDQFKKYTYHMTYKHEWIHEPHTEVSWSSHEEILKEIKLKHLQKRAPIVWIRKTENSIEKCFVVWW